MAILNFGWYQAIESQQWVLLSISSVLAIALIYASLPEQHANVPYLNRPAKLDFFQLKARHHFVLNTRSLMEEGRRLFKGGLYRMFTDVGELIVIPSQYIDDIRNNESLSFMKFFINNFHVEIPGFDGFKFDGREDELLHRTINKKLNKLLNQVTLPLSHEAEFATNLILGTSSEWQEKPVLDTMLEIIARLSSLVFLGDELCRNQKWLEITKSYTVNTSIATDKLRQYPKFLRPLVCRFIPECRELERQVKVAQLVFAPVLQKRKEAREVAQVKGDPLPSYNDTIQWLAEENRGEPYDVVGAQLGFSVVAIHTTSDLLTETMLRLAVRPDLMDDIRKEIETVLKAEGWTKTALFNMKLLDSSIKEAQRLKPITSATMNRTATKRVTLPGGVVLEKGDRCVSDLGSMVDPDFYPDPYEYDGYRFHRMRGDPKMDSKAHLISTSAVHLGFGHGKHACPGRFFAAIEIKLVLCHLLHKYDWKLEDGYVHKVSEFGLSLLPDGQAKIRFRRRQNLELDIDHL